MKYTTWKWYFRRGVLRKIALQFGLVMQDQIRKESLMTYTLEDQRLEHTNYPFRKENDLQLPNLYDYVPC